MTLVTNFKSQTPTRRQLKARRDRQEAAVEKAVRAACVERDGYCRLRHLPEALYGDLTRAECGPSEWAHLPTHSRARTRGQAPEARHATAGSLMLCTRHHDALDGRSQPRLTVEALTDRGADGPLWFAYKGRTYSEA